MDTEIEISPNGSLLVYKIGYTPEFVQAVIRDRKLNGLRIFAHLEDQRLTSLDFLGDYTFLESLAISSIDDYDFGFLSNLGGLRHLSVETEGQNLIDLSCNRNLKSLTLHWRKGRLIGLENCQNIEALSLVDFKSDDFLPVSQLIKLNSLNVKTASIVRTDGLKNLSMLKNLSLGNCKRLKNIEEIGDLNQLLELNLERCRHIEDYRPIGKLSTLKILRISDCGGVGSIGFVSDLSRLEKLVLLGNTNILDGDLKVARNIQDVVYKHREHYNHEIVNKEYDQLVTANLKKIKELFQ